MRHYHAVPTLITPAALLCAHGTFFAILQIEAIEQKCDTEVMEMRCEHLSLGATVLLLRPYMGLPEGSSGRILHIYQSDSALYRVQFSTHAHAIPVYRDYLYPGDSESANGTQAHAELHNRQKL
jgi:hypothetical protein